MPPNRIAGIEEKIRLSPSCSVLQLKPRDVLREIARFSGYSGAFAALETGLLGKNIPCNPDLSSALAIFPLWAVVSSSL